MQGVLRDHGCGGARRHGGARSHCTRSTWRGCVSALCLPAVRRETSLPASFLSRGRGHFIFAPNLTVCIRGSYHFFFLQCGPVPAASRRRRRATCRPLPPRRCSTRSQQGGAAERQAGPFGGRRDLEQEAVVVDANRPCPDSRTYSPILRCATSSSSPRRSKHELQVLVGGRHHVHPRFLAQRHARLILRCIEWPLLFMA